MVKRAAPLVVFMLALAVFASGSAMAVEALVWYPIANPNFDDELPGSWTPIYSVWDDFLVTATEATAWNKTTVDTAPAIPGGSQTDPLDPQLLVYRWNANQTAMVVGAYQAFAAPLDT